MAKQSKAEQREAAFTEAFNNSVHVTNSVDLRSEVCKKSLVIVSTEAALYEKLIERFPKAKVAKGSRTAGKVLVGLGTAITVLSFGAFSFVGIPIAGAGVALGSTGLVLDDYKDYTILMDYDEKRVIFIKTKGTPKLDVGGITPGFVGTNQKG